MKRESNIFLICVVSILLALCVFYGAQAFFQSQMMSQFIWNINTFRGLFAYLPDNLPKEHIIGSYAFAFKDYYAHLPRTVSQNASYYAALLGLLCAAYCPFLFWSQYYRPSQKFRSVVTLGVILILGTGIRLFFAYHTTCNHDIVSWYIDRAILEEGKNIFAVTERYNYSPFWFSILKFLAQVNRLLPQFPFMFIVRAFLTFVDLLTLAIVIRLAQVIHFSPQKAAALFFLNPIGIIITGYHGQFDNIPVLFLLSAILLYLQYGKRFFLLSWLLITAGFITKHEIMQQLLIFFRQVKGSRIKALLWFAFSVTLFFLSFAPYWSRGAGGILGNVFGYGGISRPYGFIMLDFNIAIAQWHKYFFVGLLLLWPFCFQTPQLLRSSLIGMLVFLIFTSGISAQQFILPVALAALQPSLGFYLFSAVSSLFLFGNIDELKIHFFEFIDWNCIWIAATGWFVLELNKKRQVPQAGESDRLLFQNP